MKLDQIFSNSFAVAAQCLSEFLSDNEATNMLVAIAEKLSEMDGLGGKVLIAGNGGSMADAMHFAEEWTGRFRRDRRPLPALALADPTHLSCVANDYGFQFGFSRMVEALAKPEDVVILLSTSGNSENLVLAAEAARQKGATVIGFLGRGGGRLLPLCDLSVMAPGETSDRIQEIHMLCLHILVEAVEASLGID